jgi:hypothetical protein
MHLARALGPYLVLSALLGGACDSSVSPITVVPSCPDMPIRGPEQYKDEASDLLISDFETSDNFLAKVANRDGYWIAGYDLTNKAPVTEITRNCAARGQFAGHFSGDGYTSWWANWTAIFRDYIGNKNVLPCDGEGYSAVSFWAAFGSNNGPDFQVPVGIVTMDTAYNGGICVTAYCSDHYMTKVALTHDWQRYVVHFDEMKQLGIGMPQLAMRKDQLVGFIIWPRQKFDIWIDDVRFEP